MTYSLFQPDEVNAPPPPPLRHLIGLRIDGQNLRWLQVNKQVKWRPSKTTADSNTKMAKSLTYKSRPKKNE